MASLGKIFYFFCALPILTISEEVRNHKSPSFNFPNVVYPSVDFLHKPYVKDFFNNNKKLTVPSNQIIKKRDALNSVKSNYECQLKPDLKREIRAYKPIVDRIIDASINGKLKGKVYKELADFVDKFGSRLSGTDNLENSIDYMINLLNNSGLENVHGETAFIPHWIRGKESVTMLYPRIQEMSILGLGGSVATPSNGIIAEVLVVRTFEELHSKANQAGGKIVVYNQNWVSYPVSVKYRVRGAVEAAKVGAVASLIRSVTPQSLYTPHTGQQNYEDNVKKIPTACITVEDAELLQRISDRGEKIIINLTMKSETLPKRKSRNTVAEILGKTQKDEIVLVSGHIDSWDVGSGALDDGVGAFVSWYSLVVLKALNLRPKRTVRAVLWVAEEPGLVGVQQYVKDHFDELNKFNLVMESDEGAFTPEGIRFAGVRNAACVIKEVASLMCKLNATKFEVDNYVSSDITKFQAHGVPGAEIINKNENYFWYHHTNADSMTALNSDDLDKNMAMFAAISYVVADLSQNLPRENLYQSNSNEILKN